VVDPDTVLSPLHRTEFLPLIQVPWYRRPSDHSNTPLPCFLSSSYSYNHDAMWYSCVFAPILPDDLPLPVHLVLLPRSRVDSLVRPNVGALPVDIVVRELA
jgi:hypothetical protein